MSSPSVRPTQEPIGVDDIINWSGWLYVGIIVGGIILLCCICCCYCCFCRSCCSNCTCPDCDCSCPSLPKSSRAPNKVQIEINAPSKNKSRQEKREREEREALEKQRIQRELEEEKKQKEKEKEENRIWWEKYNEEEKKKEEEKKHEISTYKPTFIKLTHRQLEGALDKRFVQVFHLDIKPPSKWVQGIGELKNASTGEIIFIEYKKDIDNHFRYGKEKRYSLFFEYYNVPEADYIFRAKLDIDNGEWQECRFHANYSSNNGSSTTNNTSTKPVSSSSNTSSKSKSKPEPKPITPSMVKAPYVTVTSNGVSDKKSGLIWTADRHSSDKHTFKMDAEYSVKSSGKWIKIRPTTERSRSNEYKVTGLKSQTHYQFRARFYNGSDYGKWSNNPGTMRTQ